MKYKYANVFYVLWVIYSNIVAHSTLTQSPYIYIYDISISPFCNTSEVSHLEKYIGWLWHLYQRHWSMHHDIHCLIVHIFNSGNCEFFFFFGDNLISWRFYSATKVKTGNWCPNDPQKLVKFLNCWYTWTVHQNNQAAC